MRHYANEKFENGQWVPDFEKSREDFKRATVTDGVVRWTESGNFPMRDMMEMWRDMGLPFDFAKSEAAREAWTTECLAKHRKAQKNRKPSAEELFEMRAAFGPGGEVVNILTGKVTRT
jgi:hypothetical protein